jgi:hypothetical protein
MSQHTIPHTETCPACGSTDLVIGDADTTDGHTEIALTCLDCDTCWPLTCLTGQAADDGGEP